MKGRLLNEPTVDDLVAAARRAASDGIDAVFLSTGPLGDAITLAAAVSTTTPNVLLGIRTGLGEEPHRHPTVMARDMTALDLVSGGRTVLAFTPPFGAEVGEAITLCRDMWREGVAASEGPYYPVAGAINRPQPRKAGSPRLALDLTADRAVEAALLGAVDFVLVAEGDANDLPDGVDVCLISPPS